MAWKYWPGGPTTMLSSGGWGVMPASTWTPTEVTSGFSQAPRGPRDEKDAMMSPGDSDAMPVVHVAVTPEWEPRNASMSAPSSMLRWIAGSQWLSVSTSVTAVL
jgi:hypothetical protein